MGEREQTIESIHENDVDLQRANINLLLLMENKMGGKVENLANKHDNLLKTENKILSLQSLTLEELGKNPSQKFQDLIEELKREGITETNINPKKKLKDKEVKVLYSQLEPKLQNIHATAKKTLDKMQFHYTMLSTLYTLVSRRDVRDRIVDNMAKG